EWEIPKTEGMNVPGVIFADEKLLNDMDEKVKEQITNVAYLPGIQQASLAMPDAHWGYGFPIGGVAAFDPEENGIISAGGVGYDISCGVRTMRTDLKKEELMKKINELVDDLFKTVPAGLGSKGEIKLNTNEIDEMLTGGAEWAVSKGYGTKDDLEFTEMNGKATHAEPSKVSDMAKKREEKQCGTLGSGNHYLELQYVDEVFDERIAKIYGLEKDQILVSIHCGSRGLGHQVCSDYIKVLDSASKKYGIPIRDRELVCAPINSDEGRDYFGAMNAAINNALANRHVIAHLVRQSFERVFPDAEVTQLYDTSHNTCRVEEHEVDGKKKTVYVHRKGATAALGPNRPELPKAYKKAGQPVLIGGTMGTHSYVLAGTEYGTKKSFGSACHGAGRAMSRTQAKKEWWGEKVISDLAAKGIIVRSHSFAGVAEEAPGAYKDVTEVVDAVHNAGLSVKVVKAKPLASIKG
ncbi:RtcB family protein, partial [Candidatus Micrarchaeota archaeon]|nr:RtcB family protein [Candidatus Micrarchaeota archaeon]